MRSGIVGLLVALAHLVAPAEAAKKSYSYYRQGSTSGNTAQTDAVTALLISSGSPSVLGGAGYFLAASGTPEVCQPKKSLTYTGVGVYRLTNGGTFDLDRRVGVDRVGKRRGAFVNRTVRFDLLTRHPRLVGHVRCVRVAQGHAATEWGGGRTASPRTSCPCSRRAGPAGLP